MVWRGMSLKGLTELYSLDNGPLTAFRCWDEVLGPFSEPALVRVDLGSSWCKDITLLTGPHALLT